MVDGADTFLDMLSEGNDYVALHISVTPLEGYDELVPIGAPLGRRRTT